MLALHFNFLNHAMEIPHSLHCLLEEFWCIDSLTWPESAIQGQAPAFLALKLSSKVGLLRLFLRGRKEDTAKGFHPTKVWLDRITIRQYFYFWCRVNVIWFMLQYVTVWNISFDNISSAVNTGEINTTDLFWPLFFFLILQMSWLASLKNCPLRNISLFLRNKR